MWTDGGVFISMKVTNKSIIVKRGMIILRVAGANKEDKMFLENALKDVKLEVMPKRFPIYNCRSSGG